MKIYVVEKGCYESRHISGVYASLEAAIRAHPIPPNQVYPEGYRGGGWKYNADFSEWNNGLDWDDAAIVTEYEVED